VSSGSVKIGLPARKVNGRIFLPLPQAGGCGQISAHLWTDTWNWVCRADNARPPANAILCTFFFLKEKHLSLSLSQLLKCTHHTLERASPYSIILILLSDSSFNNNGDSSDNDFIILFSIDNMANSLFFF